MGGGGDRRGGHDLSGQPAPARTGPEPRIAREPQPGPDAVAVRPALAPVWASHITVPVFLVGALEDEEVGPQWPALVTALERDKNVYVTMMNGTHTDSLGPDTISRWLEFLDLYVAGRVPSPSPTLTALAPVLYAHADERGEVRRAAPPCASRPSPRSPRRRPPSRSRIRASGCSSTTAAAASGPGPCSPPTRPGSRRGRPPGTIMRFALGARRHPHHGAPAHVVHRRLPARSRRPPAPTTCPPPPTRGPPSRPTTGRPSRLRTGSRSRRPPSPRRRRSSDRPASTSP